MKTKTNTNSKLYTKSNIIVLMVGFLTPVVLLGSLAVSMLKQYSSEEPETTQTVTVESVAISNEMYAAPKAYIYNKSGENEITEEEKTAVISPDASNICLMGALLPNFSRY